MSSKILFEFTQEEYVKFGEDEYQRGYNSYKESEGIEFLERIARIESLINIAYQIQFTIYLYIYIHSVVEIAYQI